MRVQSPQAAVHASLEGASIRMQSSPLSACGLWPFLGRMRRERSHGYRPVSGPYTPHGGSFPLEWLPDQNVDPVSTRAGRGAVKSRSGSQTGGEGCTRHLSKTYVHYCPDLCLSWSEDTQSEAIPAEDFPGQVEATPRLTSAESHFP